MLRPYEDVLDRVGDESAPYCEHNRERGVNRLFRAIVILPFPRISASLTCGCLCLLARLRFYSSTSLSPSPLRNASDTYASLLKLFAEFAAIPTSWVGEWKFAYARIIDNFCGKIPFSDENLKFCPCISILIANSAYMH